MDKEIRRLPLNEKIKVIAIKSHYDKKIKLDKELSDQIKLKKREKEKEYLEQQIKINLILTGQTSIDPELGLLYSDEF